MFCIVAFIILSILGIFSATNRRLAREALDCVLRRVTFRPCNTGFDEKMKAKILGSLIMRSETAARFVSKNFELLAWVFFALLLGSGIFFVRGTFLYYTTGSCNGMNATGFCVFDPTGENNQISTTNANCKVDSTSAQTLTLDGVNLDQWPTLNAGAPDKIIFIGCYACEYSRKAWPEIRSLADRYKVELAFGEYPTKEKSDYLSRVGYCVYKQDPQKYWQFNDELFAHSAADVQKDEVVNQILTGLGLDARMTTVCAADFQTMSAVKQQQEEIKKTNFYGTPTIFFNGEPMVGPKPYRVYAIALKGLFYWLR